MAADLILELRNPQLHRQGGQIDPAILTALTVTPRWNSVGAWAVTLPKRSDVARLLAQPGWGLIITQGTTVLMSGDTVNPQLVRTADDPAGTVTLAGVDDNTLLDDNVVWPSPATTDLTSQGGTSATGYDQRTGKAETVMRGYVNANIGPSAPAARRPAGTLASYLTVAADQARGATVTGQGRWQKLGELLTTLSNTGGGLGFRVRQNGDGALLFEVYQPRDLSKTVRLDIANDAIQTLTYSYTAPAATVAIVGGAGDESARVYQQVTTTDSSAAQALWHRRIERFVDSSGTADLTELTAAGADSLATDGKTVTSLTVELADAGDFGARFGLGDTVTVVVDPDLVAAQGEITDVVTEATITLDATGLKAKTVIGAPTAGASTTTDPVLGLVLRQIRDTQRLARRVSGLERRK